MATALAGAGIAVAAGRASHGRATCAHQSIAAFPRAYTNSRNLVIGPLVLVGARAYSSPETVRRFGGQKYPALVAAGHTVKVAMSARARKSNALTYADSVHSSRSVADGLRIVTFQSCSRRDAGSDADGRPVTFWSGGILASAPRCLRLKIWVDGASTPRRARIPIGRRC
ncbi:MAG: hypothetical protein M3N56_07120 [Actinomycetota bacterium]|nr:hypothetical protein [Actinomycetota bacterium]